MTRIRAWRSEQPDRGAAVINVCAVQMLITVALSLLPFFFFQALKIKYPNQVDQKVLEKQLPGKKNRPFASSHLGITGLGTSWLEGNCLQVWTSGA